MPRNCRASILQATRALVDKLFTCRIQSPNRPRQGRVGAPGGAARRGQARLGANRSIRQGNKSVPYPPKNEEMSLQRLNKRNPMQTDRGTKSPVDPRLTTGPSAVYQRFTSGRRSAFLSWLQTRGTMLFWLCKPFSCKACPGINAWEDHTLQERANVRRHVPPDVVSGSIVRSILFCAGCSAVSDVLEWEPCVKLVVGRAKQQSLPGTLDKEFQDFGVEDPMCPTCTRGGPANV